MKYTKIPTDAFQKLQVNAGMLVRGSTGFVPSTGTVTTANIMGATTGGVTVSCVPTFSDRGEDVDNCPKSVQYRCLKLRDVLKSVVMLRFVRLNSA